MKSKALLGMLADDSHQTPPPHEKLVGDLTWAYSRRINIQHRLVYQILDDEDGVKVLRMFSLSGAVGGIRDKAVSRVLHPRPAHSLRNA